MATLIIPDSTYRRLQIIAERRRLSLNAYLDEVASQGASTPSDSARQLAAIEAFASGMSAWTSDRLPPGHVTDDSRETIYEGRGG